MTQNTVNAISEFELSLWCLSQEAQRGLDALQSASRDVSLDLKHVHAIRHAKALVRRLNELAEQARSVMQPVAQVAAELYEESQVEPAELPPF